MKQQLFASAGNAKLETWASGEVEIFGSCPSSSGSRSSFSFERWSPEATNTQRVAVVVRTDQFTSSLRRTIPIRTSGAAGLGRRGSVQSTNGGQSLVDHGGGQHAHRAGIRLAQGRGALGGRQVRVINFGDERLSQLLTQSRIGLF